MMGAIQEKHKKQYPQIRREGESKRLDRGAGQVKEGGNKDNPGGEQKEGR